MRRRPALRKSKLCATPLLRDSERVCLCPWPQGGANEKIAALRAAGVTVVPSPAQMGAAMLAEFKKRNMV